MAEDNIVTQIIGSLGLNYTPAITAGQAFSKSIDNINMQLLNMQAMAKRTSAVFAADMAAGLNRSKVILDQYGRVLKEVQSATITQAAGTSAASASAAATYAVNQAMDISTSKQRINEMFISREQAAFEAHYRRLTATQKVSEQQRLMLQSQYLAKAEANSRQFFAQQMTGFSQLTDQMDRRFGWFMSSIAMFGAINMFQKTVEAISDVEMGMVQIQRVTEDATASFSLMRDQLFDLGIKYGTEMATVQDIALRWAQAGYNVQDTLKLTETALLALNTAELNAEQSTQAMIGIMAQWQYTANDLPLVLDKINKTADDFAVTSQDLIDGLLRSSGAARTMNMEFDQLLGILVATREASGRTGREVGNAVNSILSYMQRPKAIETFESFGVKVFADEAKTQFRNVIEIFNELASKWDSTSDGLKDGFIQAADDADLFNEEVATALGLQEEWNDLQKRDLSQAAAGVYRRNYFIALLRNFAQAQEVVNNLVDAEGYSVKENERTMESLEKRVQSLKTSFAALAVEIGDAGLLDTIKDLTSGVTSFNETFRDLPTPVKQAILLFFELGTAIAVSNLALRMFTGAGYGTMLIQLAAQVGKVEAATLGLGAALRILARNPIMWVITAVTAGIVAFKQYKKAQEEAAEEALKAYNQADQHAKSVEELGSKYEKLTAQLAEGKDVQSELNGTMNEIAEIFPQVVEQWDNQGNAIKINNERLRENIQLAREAAQANALEALTAAEKEVDRLKKKQDSLNQAMAVAPSADIVWSMGGPMQFFPDAGETAGNLRSISTEIDKAEALVKRYQTILGLIESPAPVPAAGGTGTTGSGGGSGSGSGASNGNLNDFNKGYEHSLDMVDAALSRVTLREQILEDQIKNGAAPTVQWITDKYNAYTDTINQNAYRQTVLHAAADAARAQLASLTQGTGDAAYASADLADEIYSLEKEIYEYGTAWMEADYSIKQAMASLEEMQWLSDAYAAALQKQSEAIEEAYQARKELLEEEVEANEELIAQKQEAIESIEKWRDSEVKAIQDVIDALEEEKETEDRIEAEREYNKEIADLEDDALYHSLRTGREHRDAVADINEEIAEKQHDWQQKQNEWAREDRKQALQDEIEDIKDRAQVQIDAYKEEISEIKKTSDAKKKELEKYYKEAQKLTKDKTIEMLATLAATNPQWYEQGVEWMKQLAQGIKDGAEEVPQGLSGFIGSIGTATTGGGSTSGGGTTGGGATNTITISPSQYSNIGGTAYMASRSLAGVLGKDVSYDAATGQVIIGGKRFTPYQNVNGTTYVGIRQVAEALGYRVGYNSGTITISRAHTGAYVAGSGIAELLKGERVLSPQLTVSFDRLASVLAGMPSIPDRISMMSSGGFSDTSIDRLIKAIESRKGIQIGTLFKAENVKFNDKIDMDYFSKQQGQIINKLATAQG